jgi:hypothetical protein
MSTEIEAELYCPPDRPDVMTITIKTNDGVALKPQHVIDAVADLLLVNYGPFLDDPHLDRMDS